MVRIRPTIETSLRISSEIDPKPVRIRFFGVRGSFQGDDQRIGHHTSCIVIEYGDSITICDTGSGVRNFGAEIMQEYTMRGREVRVNVLYTHMHGDHTFGLPSFDPLFSPKTHMHFIGGTHTFKRESHDGTIETWEETVHETLQRQILVEPTFPINYRELPCKRTFQLVRPGERFTIPSSYGDIVVDCDIMNHPGRAYGYRFHFGNDKVLALVLDHEHEPEKPEFDQKILRLCDRATLTIGEVQYTKRFYDGHMPNGISFRKGWGHMWAEAAARQFEEARTTHVITTHHEPKFGLPEVTEIVRTINETTGIRTDYAFQSMEVTL